MAASSAASKSAKKGAQISAEQSASDRDLQWQMYQQQREDADRFYGQGKGDLNTGYDAALGTLQPYTSNGPAAANRLAALAGLGGDGNSVADALRQDPGYQFRMSEGIGALDRSAASKGLLLSGAQLKGINDYGQGMASSELNNAFNRTAAVADAGRGAANNIATLQSGRGNALANLATGQASSNQNLTTNTTNAVTDINRTNTNNQIQAQTAIGQARASGYTGVANSINSGISNGLFYHGLQNGWFKQ